MAKNKIFESDYYDFNTTDNADSNKHYFLSEELLVPRANNSDTQRLDILGLSKRYKMLETSYIYSTMCKNL